MKKLIIFLAVLLLTAPVFGAYGLKYWRIEVVDSSTDDYMSDPNLTITVYASGGSSATTIYADSQATAKTNPITPGTDSSAKAGKLRFWSAATPLDVKIASATFSSTIRRNGLVRTDHVISFPIAEMVGNVSAGTISATGNVSFGVEDTGVVVTRYGDTADANVQFTGDDTQYNGISLCMGAGDQIQFGDPLGTGDFTLVGDSNVLTLDVTVAGAGQFNIGNDADDLPMTWFGETADANVQFVADDIFINAMALCLGNTDQIQLGDPIGTGDIKIYATGTSLIIDGVVAETGDVQIGADNLGIDFKVHGATTGEYFWWDASEDSILPNCGNALFTLTDAEVDQFKVDATGTVVGDAINLETTDGGIMLNADGGSNGDIELNSADDMIITSAGDTTITTTGTLSVAGSQITNQLLAPILDVNDITLTAAQSGSVVICTMTSAAATVTLPDAAAGLWYIIIDANPTAGRDLSVDPQAADKINGDTAGQKITSVNDRDGEAIFICAYDGTDWYTAAFGTSTVWTEE
jgi:hypothetical protein